MTHIRIFSLLALLLVSALLSGCGQVGALYQPPPETEGESAESSEDN